jgi:hypothetical protein
VSALAAATMIVIPYLPGGDGPQHIATAYAHVVLDAGVHHGARRSTGDVDAAQILRRRRAPA